MSNADRIKIAKTAHKLHVKMVKALESAIRPKASEHKLPTEMEDEAFLWRWL